MGTAGTSTGSTGAEGKRGRWIPPRPARIMVLTVALSMVFALTPAGVPAAAGSGPESAAYAIADGVTQPVFSYADAIRETVWVDTGTDLDRDGVPDRVAADIIRPAEPASAGREIPVIMDVSPYYACCGRGNENQLKTYEPDGTPAGFPLYYDNYFVPRGYAVVLVDVAGTNRSSGCPDDLASGRAAIDWLNGRANAYSSLTGAHPVAADWASGSVGAIGKSADGTTANGLAAGGIDGLRTIVPIAGVSSYYDVYNGDGAWFGFPQASGPPGLLNPRAAELCKPYQAEQERLGGQKGDWNRYWAGRDFTRDAHRVRASVFAVHGFFDRNVTPLHFGRWWESLAANGVPRKAWLHQGGHLDPFDLRRGEFVETLHRWFDRWLLDIDNGIDTEPAVDIEHDPGEWTTQTRWPPAGTREQTWWPRAGATAGVGTLTPAGPGRGNAAFTDDPTLDRYTWAQDPQTPAGARAAFVSEPLAADTRLAGTGSVRVTVSASTPAARVGALLVDYGPATVRDHRPPQQGIHTLDTRSCWGTSTSADSACYLDTEAALKDVDHEILASGWADIGHWATPHAQLPLQPGRHYTKTIQLSTMDFVVPAGHRIGLVLGGTDAEQFVDEGQRPDLDVDLSRTSARIPFS